MRAYKRNEIFQSYSIKEERHRHVKWRRSLNLLLISEYYSIYYVAGCRQGVQPILIRQVGTMCSSGNNVCNVFYCLVSLFAHIVQTGLKLLIRLLPYFLLFITAVSVISTCDSTLLEVMPRARYQPSVYFDYQPEYV